MKNKLMVCFGLLMLGLITTASTCVTTGGGQPGTCDQKSWGCNAYPSCISKGAYLSPEYKACASEFVTACMASGTPSCDAKKYFPNVF